MNTRQTPQLYFLINLLFHLPLSGRPYRFDNQRVPRSDKMANIPPAYSGQGEFYFLKMMAEELEKGGYTPGSTFKRESQLYVFRKFRIAFGPIYSDRFLKMKIKYLKKKHKDFSELLSQEGIYWNMEDNVVYGNEELLSKKYKCRYRDGVYHGEQYYDLMRQIFESGVKFE
ncbi:hypothetical protein OROHE_006570 [Orobanche hederae]